MDLKEVKDLIKYCKEVGVESIDIKEKTSNISVKFFNKYIDYDSKEDIYTQMDRDEPKKQEKTQEELLNELPEEIKESILKGREELELMNSCLLDPVNYLKGVKEGNIDGTIQNTVSEL